ncbi:NERD domain-containing protein [Bacillus sp. RO2]|uniref:nuclease-related domain-containing protein n=1 Tax=Bacillus sp. RO2 TaxID=2723913 RepID=UPI00145C8DA5|nr:nuclease-related domain-containing protein [Bacillus sp. RO2]NMH75107.1 NERD domain-containing protein [Bacillus sp. RO2]
MIKKPRCVPMRVHILRAMKRRVPPNHEKFQDFLNELGRKEAGIFGEQTLDYYLKLLPETEHPYYIFHGLRLPFRNTFFQMDTLILYSNFILVLEVKFFKGTLYFDPKNYQLLQEVDESPLKVYPDPILQASNQCSKLESWLRTKQFPELPCEKLAILTNPKVITKVLSSPSEVDRYVIKSPALAAKASALLKRYSSQPLEKKLIKKLIKQLLKDHSPDNSSPIAQYGILPSDIIKGVLCASCNPYKIMKRIYGTWECPNCLERSDSEHIVALKDYALLISPFITMKELKIYLGLENRLTIISLLKNLNIEFIGGTKSRTYNLTPLLTKT